MNRSERLLSWIAASVLLLVWAFPSVETTYYFWTAAPPARIDRAATPASVSGRASLDDIVEDGSWTQFHVISSHELISSAKHGLIEPTYPFNDEELIQLARRGVRFSCYGGCEKRTRIVWQSSLVYTVLILLIASGGVWAFRSSEVRRTTPTGVSS